MLRHARYGIRYSCTRARISEIIHIAEWDELYSRSDSIYRYFINKANEVTHSI